MTARKTEGHGWWPCDTCGAGVPVHATGMVNINPDGLINESYVTGFDDRPDRAHDTACPGPRRIAFKATVPASSTRWRL